MTDVSDVTMSGVVAAQKGTAMVTLTCNFEVDPADDPTAIGIAWKKDDVGFSAAQDGMSTEGEDLLS